MTSNPRPLPYHPLGVGALQRWGHGGVTVGSRWGSGAILPLATVSSAFHCTSLQLAALTRTPKINPESRSQTNAKAQRGKAATELREAFGVRGACSRFRTAPPLTTAPASWTHSKRFAWQFIRREDCITQPSVGPLSTDEGWNGTAELINVQIMKRFQMVTNSTAVSRYGTMFAPEALESGIRQCWETGLPSFMSHDHHRLLGWSVPLALHLRPGLGRLTGIMCLPETEEEERAIEARYLHSLGKRIAAETTAHRPELEKLLATCLDGSEETTAVGCAALVSSGLARRAWPKIFDGVDKDGLISLRLLKKKRAGVYERDGLLFFAHPYFRRSLSRLNTLNTAFLAELEKLAEDKSLDVRLALDPDMVGLASTYRESIEMEYWWGPKFSDEIPEMALGVTRHGATKEQRMFHGLSQTDFWWYEQGGYRTFECEELRDVPTLGAGKDSFGCRFVHSILDAEAGIPRHADGAIRMYQEAAMLKRLEVDLKRAGRHTEYTKLWRVDGIVPVATWKRLVSDYFRDNPLVGEYFGGVDEARPLEPEVTEIDERLPKVFQYVPCNMTPEDGVHISISYHPKTTTTTATRLVCSFDSLSNGSVKYQYVESDVIEVVKLLKRENTGTDFQADLVKVTFEDMVLNLPLIMHTGLGSIALANQTQCAIRLLCERSVERRLDRLVSFTLGVDYEDRACFFSVAGHIESLNRWLKLPEAALPNTLDNVGPWSTRAFYTLANQFGTEHEGPPIWNVLKESGILRFDRRLLKAGEFDIRKEADEFKIILQIPKEDIDFITNSGMRPARIWLIKESKCTSCGDNYDVCACSKTVDEGVVQQVNDAEALGMFWTNRPA
jgi:hypothetical protein